MLLVLALATMFSGIVGAAGERIGLDLTLRKTEARGTEAVEVGGSAQACSARRPLLRRFISCCTVRFKMSNTPTRERKLSQRAALVSIAHRRRAPVCAGLTGVAIQHLMKQRIGIQRYGSGTAGELWYDDYAVGTTQIGCD